MSDTIANPVSRATLIRKARKAGSIAIDATDPAKFLAPEAKPAKAAKKPAAKAAKAAKLSKAPKAPQAPKPAQAPTSAGAPRVRQATRDALANAAGGILPAAPDFSAETHKAYRKRLAGLIEMAEAGDLAGLKAADLPPPRSTSPKALIRYRDMAVVALEARAAAE
jgi:hypothetical protein